jgi:ParB family transcriptional regulator, chromosome partitioning protein
MTKKSVLGRGLSALLQENITINSAKEKGAENIVGSVINVKLEDIDINPFQPREDFNESMLQDLAISIKQLGVIQPITVRKQGDRFQLVSGERRFRASRIAGLESIPAFVRLANDQEMLEMALVENIQRQDLNAIEISLTYQRLIDEINLTQEQMSERIGKDRSTITNYLRLLKLPPSIQTSIRDGNISMGHGRAIISTDNHEKQLLVFEKILKDKLSVRQTEELVKNLKESGQIKETKKNVPKLSNSHKATLKYLNDKLHSKVNIKVNKKGAGELVVYFESDKDFERIKDLLL